MPIDIKRILNEIELLPDFEDQLILQTVEGCNDIFYGTGMINKLQHAENDFVIPIYKQLEYINQIISDLGMYRTRIMKMGPKSCYSYHYDYTKRIHIPLITNENCFMVIEDKVHRYPADGNHYLVDTTKMHTFVNASFEERIHIVGCINRQA